MRTNGNLGAVLLALTAFMPVLGCKKPGDETSAGTGASSISADAPRTDAATPSTVSANETSLRKTAIAAFLANPQAELTPAIEEAFLLDFDGRDPSERAPSVQAADTQWSTAHAHPKAAGMAEDDVRLQALATKHLSDPSPGVRQESVEIWRTGTAEDRATFLAAAKTETSPDVLRIMVHRVLRDYVKDSADAQALLLRSADSPSPDLRKAAMLVLLEPGAAGVPGGFEKVADRLANDPSGDVRYATCVHLYDTQDGRALPLFEKYLNDPATPDDVYRGCWVGLQRAWLPVFGDEQHPSAEAFRLTLAGLEKTPRTAERPPVTIEHLAEAARKRSDGDSISAQTYRSWGAASKAFLDMPRLRKALESIVLDPAASAETREVAATDLRALGESSASLVALRHTVVQMDKNDAGAAGDQELVKTLTSLANRTP